MFQRLSNSWTLFKASWQVLLADKELLVFPVLSALASLIVFASFLVPSLLAGLLDSIMDSGLDIVGTMVGFLMYVALYTVTIFFNAALIGAATIRLKGGDPTVGDGFRVAFRHLGSILGYALIAATVGMILRWLSERSGILGRIVIGLIGLVWNVATFLVVPVLVVEGIGPIEAIKRSAGLLKRTWGEQIVGNFGIGAVTGLMFLAVFIAGGVSLFLAFATEIMALVVAVLVLVVGALVLVGLISSALTGIYTAAVYEYAASGEPGDYFDPELVKQAFRPK